VANTWGRSKLCGRPPTSQSVKWTAVASRVRYGYETGWKLVGVFNFPLASLWVWSGYGQVSSGQISWIGVPFKF